VKRAFVNFLGENADGEYQVIGYESLAKAAKDYEGKNRTVRAFFSEGNFPKSGGSLTSPCQNMVTMTLELVVTAAGTVDMGTLEDPDSTDAQRALALSGATPAAYLADEYWDEFKDLLWDIIMAPQNQWLGYDENVVGSRWIGNVKKDRLVPMGEYCILTGYMELTFEVKEQSSRGKTAYALLNNRTDFSPINGDEVQKTIQETE
jgi:hypothetical protein